jgi:hypothetical protein
VAGAASGIGRRTVRAMGFAGSRRSEHGYLALVVPVLRGDARYALKVSWIDDETLNEAAALALWNGGGAVRLFDADDAAGALLLEWLDPRRSLKEEDLRVAVPVAERLLRRLAVPVPAEWPARRPVPGLRQWALDLAAELPRLWSARAGWGRRADRAGCGAGSTPWWTRLGSTRNSRVAGRCCGPSTTGCGACTMASPKIPHSARPSLTGSRSPTGRDAPADASSTYRQAAGPPVPEATAQSQALLVWS